MPTTNENRERAEQYLRAVENHRDGRIGDLDEFVAEDVVNHNPVSGDQIVTGDTSGIEAFRLHAESVPAAFSDLRFDIQDTIAEDDRVAVRFVLSGTHDGPFLGFEPTGEEVAMSGIVVYRFADWKIVERWGEANVAGFLQQIGALPDQGGR